MRAARCLSILAIMLFASPLAGSDRDFDSHWHDGRAELNGYRLKVSRYGQERNGRAVLIYVTEPFSESKRVKVEDWKKNPEDTFDALKLNMIRDFQTGIYDYNTMVTRSSASTRIGLRATTPAISKASPDPARSRLSTAGSRRTTCSSSYGACGATTSSPARRRRSRCCPASTGVGSRTSDRNG
jgi:hypothetical protein